AEDPHAVLDPERDHAAKLLPERLPRFGLEVEWVDVLVLLGRVLGVVDRAVGAVAEPLGVLLHPGMVRRALEGEVEGDLETVLAGARHQSIEVGERAELRMDRRVTALLGADRPRA